MHMADALVSTPVALTAAGAAAVLLGISGNKIKQNNRPDIVPLMGVVGAFIFAAQMIHFSIPGTGSSGHIVGGVLLAALLGPWAAFLTLASVIIIQCLVFADGGLLALGCNIVNMGAMTALVAYPLVYKPLVHYPSSAWKIMTASVLACVLGLEMGACLVTVETELSGVTALPTGAFLGFMTGIHLAIGICEGIATGLVILYVRKVRPSLLMPGSPYETVTVRSDRGKSSHVLLWSFGIAAVVLGGVLAIFASTDPDGLEWSISKLTGSPELSTLPAGHVAQTAESIQATTALMPDYSHVLSGVIGAAMVLIVIWAVSSLIVRRRVRA